MTNPQSTVDQIKPFVLDLLGTGARDTAVAAAETATTAAETAETAAGTASTDATTATTAAETATAAAGTATAAATAAQTAETNIDRYPTTLTTWTADAIGGRNLVARVTEQSNRWVDTLGNITYYNNHSLVTIPVTPGETFTFTKQDSVLASTGGYFRYGWYDAEDKLLSRTATMENSTTSTAPPEAHFLKVSYPDDSLPQVERGTQATPWTPAPEDAAQALLDGETPASPFPPHDPALTIRTDNSVGTRVFVGDTMIHGDTGWRNVSENLIPDTYINPSPDNASRGIFVKRVGDEVYWRFRLAASPALVGLSRSTRRTFLNIPAGFQQTPAMYSFFANASLGAGTVGITNASSSGVLQTETHSLAGTFEGGEELSGTIHYSTNLSWPTTLPGTPT